MRIAALTLNGLGGWPSVDLSPVMLGLNVVYGPAGSGKTTVADFLAHVLYGQPPSAVASGRKRVPAGRRGGDGERQCAVSVAAQSDRNGRCAAHGLGARRGGGGSRHRAAHARWSVAVLAATIVRDQLPPAPADRVTAERRVCAASLGRLAWDRRRNPIAEPRSCWLGATRWPRNWKRGLAGEGRASRDLDARRRELDRQIGDAEREATATEQRFRSVEAALTETDTRLRYRRLEMNADRTWWGAAPIDWEAQLAELDAQIARWRTALAELASREATVRSRLAQVQPSVGAAQATVVDEQAWLAVARQLAADLSGEVARLARASTSEQCVCRDAHPRLRPIVETLQRQLDVLAALVTERQQELTAAELELEAGHLARSQTELGRQLEYLLDRRQTVARGAQPARRVSGQ